MEEKKYSSAAQIRFILFIILGILIFFINFQFGEQKTTPYDYLCVLLVGATAVIFRWLLLATGIYMLYVLIKGKFWKNTAVQIVLDCLKIIGAVLLILDGIGILPGFIAASGLWDGVQYTYGEAFMKMLLCFLLLPLITDYGLPEAIGVFLRPLTKKLWRLPGRTAIIISSAFVGSYFVGIAQAGQLYENGKLSHREGTLLATGFSTASLGYIVFLSGLAGITNMFGTLVLVSLITLFIINIIICRIPPISKYKDDYYEGATPDIEPDYKYNSGMFKDSYGIACELSEKSGSILPKFGKMFLRGLPMVTSLVCTAVGCVVIFGFINMYTPVFDIIGFIFLPILKLFGLPDAAFLANNTALCMISNMAGPIAMASGGASVASRFYGIIFMAPMVLFMTDFLACLCSTKIKVNIVHMFILWVERAIIACFLCALCARIFCGI